MFCELLFAFQATRPLHFLNLRLFRSFRFTQFLAGTMRIHHHDWTNEKNHCKKYKPNNGQRRVVALFHHPLYFHLGECLIFFVRLGSAVWSLTRILPYRYQYHTEYRLPRRFRKQKNLNLWNTNMSREVLVLSSVASAFAYCDVNGVIYDDDCNSGGW